MKTPLPPLPDCSGSPHLSDIKGLEVFRAAVGKLVMGIGGRATVLELGRNCRLPLQQRAIVISKDLGVEEYFNALLGQVPEQLAGTAAFEPSPVVS